MKVLSRFSQAAQHFGNRFSNRQLRAFALFVLAVHYLSVWTFPAYESSFPFVFAITLLVLTLGRPVPAGK